MSRSFHAAAGLVSEKRLAGVRYASPELDCRRQRTIQLRMYLAHWSSKGNGSFDGGGVPGRGESRLLSGLTEDGD